MTVGELEKALAQIEDKSIHVRSTAESGYVVVGINAVSVGYWAGTKQDGTEWESDRFCLLSEIDDFYITNRKDGHFELVAEGTEEPLKT